MKYQPLGNTGLYVSNLTLGAMTFGRNDDDRMAAQLIGATGQALADKMVDMAIEAGVNFFDTANIYHEGDSEIALGKALGDKRKDVVIATKLHGPMGRDMNNVGQSRIAIMREVEDSLKRLGTDWIDLYQVHSFDETTPLEETLRALDDLVHQGKVRYLGLCNYPAWRIAQADGLARLLGTERYCSVQAYYSLVGRDLEREILPAAQGLGLGTMIWSPLAGGFLSGKYTRDGASEGRRQAFQFPPVDPDRGFAILDVVNDIAQQRGVTAAEVSLAWLLHKPGVTTVIMGAKNESQLTSNLKAADLELSEDEMTLLDEVSQLAPEYPGWITSFSWQRGKTMDEVAADAVAATANS